MTVVRSLHTMRSDGSLNLRHIEACCKDLRSNLPRYIEATTAAAPARQDGFVLIREGAFVSDKARQRGKQLPESDLERKLWTRWGKESSQGVDFISQHCRYIQSYQVPLKATHQDKGWGKVDLVGVAPSLEPVILELKAGSASDPLHQVIVEGIAYAIALRKVWRESKSLRQEWAKSLDVSLASLPEALTTSKVICLAPEEYWERAFATERRSGRIPDNARSELRGLIDDLLPLGFQVLLASFHPKSLAPAHIVSIP